MAKKTAKQPPHLRVRIEPKLIARLEKAREANGNTLTGEIVQRLETTFSTEDKIALFKESTEKRIEDIRRGQTEARELIERERQSIAAETEEILAELAEYRAKTAKEAIRLEEEIKRAEEGMKREIAIVDTLLGEDPAAKEAIRAIVLLLATSPGWAATELGVRKVAEDAAFIIRTVAKQGKEQ